VRRALGIRPLMALGIISYGAYLIHWPVFVFVDHARTGLGEWQLFIVQIAITIVLAVFSFYVVERPVRLKRVAIPKLRILTPIAFALVITTGLAIWRAAPTPATDLNVSRSRYEKQQATLGKESVNQGGGPEFAMYGDSTALMLSLGLGSWGYSHTNVLREKDGFADLGCGLLQIPRRIDGTEFQYDTKCANWPARWNAAATKAASIGVDTSVIALGPWEVADGQLPGSSKWVSIGNPAYDAAEKAALIDGIDVLLKHSSRVLILESPYIQRGRVDGQAPPTVSTQSSHARMDGWNALVREFAAERPNVQVVYYGKYFNDHPQDDDRLRPDGVHLTWPTATQVAGWLGPELAATIAHMSRAK